jgi:peptidoglycan/LPS O-acetylase OafA/YrhL
MPTGAKCLAQGAACDLRHARIVSAPGKFGLTSNTSTPPERLYRPDIDGLRALAILSVVLYHAGIPGITGGFTGVDIFFVISGYLIGGQIYSQLSSGSFSYLQFYRRRARRILPAFFAVVAFILLAALVLLSPYEAAQTARSAFAATLSASNILFWATANYFAPKTELNPLLMTWSLGVEEQFYAVIPLLMVLLTRSRRNWLLPAILAVSAVSFLYAWNQLGSSPMMAFYMLPARAWELGAGVALAAAELQRSRRQLAAHVSQIASVTGLALLLAPVFLLTAATPFPGPAALPTVLGTALLIAAPASWINRHLLALPALTFIGRISYSWYLWHWPTIAFLRVINGGDLPPQPAPILVMAASLIPAVLSYHFIEQPFRRSKRQPVPLLVRYAAVTAAFLAASGAIWLAHGLPQRFPQLARIESAAQALKSDPCLVGERDAPNQTLACYDVSSAQPSIGLWGDSHAAAIAPGLRSAAGAQGYGFVELAKNSCLPLTGATHYLPQAPQRAAACTRFNRKTLAMLQAEPRIRVVVLAASWAAPLNRNPHDGWLTPDSTPTSPVPSLEVSEQLFAHSLAASIRDLQAAGKQVIVFQDTPNFDFDPMMKVRTAQIPARHNLAIWLRAPDAADPGAAWPVTEPSIPRSISLIEQTVAGFPGVQLIDLRQVFCDSLAQCAYRKGESLLFSDSSHLTPGGAALAVRGLELPSPASTPR